MIISYVRTIFLYLVLIFAIRLMGKRQIGQMEPSEFVVTMLVANLASIPMQNAGLPLYSGLIPILTVLGLELCLSGIIMHSDIDEDILDVAYESAVRAGVEEHLNIFTADARKIKKEDRRGTIACNPPYGERLMDQREVAALYADMGRAFEELLPWQIYVITSCENFERLYGRRADKVKKLYNGMIPCNLYEFFKPRDQKPNHKDKRK